MVLETRAMNRQAIVAALTPKYTEQEKNRVRGVVKESNRPVIVRVSPARIQAFALIRTMAGDDMPASLKPIPRVLRECQVWATSLDFRSADELVELWEWCEKTLSMEGSPYALLRETLGSIQHSIEEGFPEVEDVAETAHQFGDYTLNVSKTGVRVTNGQGNEVESFKTMKQALAWVGEKISESAA